MKKCAGDLMILGESDRETAVSALRGTAAAAAVIGAIWDLIPCGEGPVTGGNGS